MAKRGSRRAQTRTVVPAKKTSTSQLTMDMLINEYARLGTQDNLLAMNQYQANRLTQQYALMDNLFRGDWIANRIITTIPEDMTKNWYSLTCTVEPDKLDVLAAVERKTHVRQRILEGLRWGRLYGGAAAVMIIKGQEDMLEEPLDLDLIMPGDFKGLIIADRWNGVYPSSELVEDLDDPDFGLPEYYTFAMSDTEIANGIRVHHSRVLRFAGRELPFIEKIAEQYWGMSELEHVYTELNKRNSASANIAQLIFIAHLRVLKMENLGQNLALNDIWSQNDLYNTLSAQNFLMNNMSLQVMSRDDEFQTFDYTFSGLADVYEQFMLDVAGASEIPATKLFGRAPQGMNATGEGDLRNYYDTVRQNQETHLRPVLEKLLPVICISAWGAIPDDLDFEFNPIRDTSDEERASLIQQSASAINSVFQAGIISQKIALMELRKSGTEYGMWASITDEFIDSADDSASPEGEMPGGMPGEEGGMPGMMPPEEAPEEPAEEPVEEEPVEEPAEEAEEEDLTPEQEELLQQVAEEETEDGGPGSGNFNHPGYPRGGHSNEPTGARTSQRAGLGERARMIGRIAQGPDNVARRPQARTSTEVQTANEERKQWGNLTLGQKLRGAHEQRKQMKKTKKEAYQAAARGDLKTAKQIMKNNPQYFSHSESAQKKVEKETLNMQKKAKPFFFERS